MASFQAFFRTTSSRTFAASSALSLATSRISSSSSAYQVDGIGLALKEAADSLAADGVRFILQTVHLDAVFQDPGLIEQCNCLSEFLGLLQHNAGKNFGGRKVQRS